jgi:hypothetical protein
MNSNEQTLNRFYTAFAELDADTMAGCYAEDVRFDDPVFSLRGRHEAGGMWRMLCAATRATGRDAWKLEFSDIHADASNGRAHWEAHYRFSLTGRLVHNSIDAQFTFKPDGLIATHRDHFNFWNWSRQALGTPGLLLGWTPLLQARVRSQARANLRKYVAGKT